MESPKFDLSGLQQAAVEMHELYLTFQQAGFEKPEALYLIGQMVRPNPEGN